MFLRKSWLTGICLKSGGSEEFIVEEWLKLVGLRKVVVLRNSYS